LQLADLFAEVLLAQSASSVPRQSPARSLSPWYQLLCLIDRVRNAIHLLVSNTIRQQSRHVLSTTGARLLVLVEWLPFSLQALQDSVFRPLGQDKVVATDDERCNLIRPLRCSSDWGSTAPKVEQVL